MEHELPCIPQPWSRYLAETFEKVTLRHWLSSFRKLGGGYVFLRNLQERLMTSYHKRPQSVVVVCNLVSWQNVNIYTLPVLHETQNVRKRTDMNASSFHFICFWRNCWHSSISKYILQIKRHDPPVRQYLVRCMHGTLHRRLLNTFVYQFEWAIVYIETSMPNGRGLWNGND
jgi:hypothetical protein